LSYKVEKDVHSCIIYHAKKSDGGEYMVTAENEVGKAKTAAYLSVEGLFIFSGEIFGTRNALNNFS
jgi:hypothetical protein